jgi:hypothetical protein
MPLSKGSALMSEPITMFEVTEGKSYWLQLGLARGHMAEVRSADALIVPEKDFRQGVPYVFHQDTTTLYQYLKKSVNGQFLIEVCADDHEFVEISLHSASFRISTIVVTFAVAPLLVNLLSSYLYDYMKAKPTDSVEASLVIEDHECRAFKFNFKGEAKDFNLLADKVGELARNCEAASGNKKGKTAK